MILFEKERHLKRLNIDTREHVNNLLKENNITVSEFCEKLNLDEYYMQKFVDGLTDIGERLAGILLKVKVIKDANKLD